MVGPAIQACSAVQSVSREGLSFWGEERDFGVRRGIQGERRGSGVVVFWRDQYMWMGLTSLYEAS